MPVNAAHERYVTALLETVRADRYPSHHLLARIEASITDREVAEAYIDAILAEVERQRYPSLRMIDRANRIVEMLAKVDLAEEARERADA